MSSVLFLEHVVTETRPRLILFLFGNGQGLVISDRRILDVFGSGSIGPTPHCALYDTAAGCAGLTSRLVINPVDEVSRQRKADLVFPHGHTNYPTFFPTRVKRCYGSIGAPPRRSDVSAAAITRTTASACIPSVRGR